MQVQEIVKWAFDHPFVAFFIWLVVAVILFMLGRIFIKKNGSNVSQNSREEFDIARDALMIMWPASFPIITIILVFFFIFKGAAKVAEMARKERKG